MQKLSQTSKLLEIGKKYFDELFNDRQQTNFSSVQDERLEIIQEHTTKLVFELL